MCGIIGYSGPRQAAPVLLDSLQRLEYRGYDSAGVAVLDDDGGATTVAKSNRKVVDLVSQFEVDGMPRGHTGIGHTRWATHGRPTVINAHPHRDCTGRIHIIHNGIIEGVRVSMPVNSAWSRFFAASNPLLVARSNSIELFGDLNDPTPVSCINLFQSRSYRAAGSRP